MQKVLLYVQGIHKNLGHFLFDFKDTKTNAEN